MIDEYRVPEAIADALELDHLRMAPGPDLLWDVLQQLAEKAPFVTVAELNDAMTLFCDRYRDGYAALECLPTVPAPEAMQ